MKRTLLILLLLLALPLSALATRVMVVTDIHYMDKALYADSDLFIRALRAGDGKLTQYSDELMTALLCQVAERRPDALIVTGDLTFNGEKVSHEALAGWSDKIEALGVPVWVIPGNHDINCLTARGFKGDSWYYTDPVTPEAFSAIYKDFMLPAEGEAGLSYLAPIDDALSVAMTDVSFYEGGAQSFGLFMAGHAAFLEDAARRSACAHLITATHHSLLPHTEFMKDSFLMLGSEAMVSTMRENGIQLNLSGHIHIQHISQAQDVTDAALGAFCVWPHRFAMLTVAGDTAEYEALALDEVYLPGGFMDMSREWFDGITREKVAASLGDVQDIDALADYAARFNLAYFSGAYRSDDPSWKDDPAHALWQTHADNVFWQYMRMVMEEPNGDNLRLSLALQP